MKFWNTQNITTVTLVSNIRVLLALMNWKTMNNKYKIKIKHPLVRAGIEIETESSEKYLVEVLKKVLEKVREFNKGESDETAS